MLVDKTKDIAHIVCIKMAVNSPRRKILLFLSTNDGRHDVTCKPSIEAYVYIAVSGSQIVGLAKGQIT